ncbi:hypothetical protein CC85DRAFT_324956 [Cutaneotrichosporon oleaginosum]|uniref:Uncharacterized protein n=1 Tax=Cutaneotrichosporon oleaginosum TaxID=879819 RepID=A0A0J0XYM8_9TREE|nr:uncharacterized protein CC85DRAFT_324956 [Cutaneotrichosporon oleaginosum]KLT46153.1 hypothetical protein CC85DRAFT_324956 [Cutaneotrichosporon oleaginosum]TXT10163.1 hypothetical protein COLE_04097 [Cutaneotrichosporon oleaginosum]
MLVPLVLRNIVLPYLRSGSRAGVAASQAQRRRVASTAAAAAAHAQARTDLERDDVRWEPFRIGPRAEQVLSVHRRPPNKPPLPSASEAKAALSGPPSEPPREPEAKPNPESDRPGRPRKEEKRGRAKVGGDSQPTSKTPPAPSSKPSHEPERKRSPQPPPRSDEVDLTRVRLKYRALSIPVPLRKLLDAKLYRAAVFSLLEAPEWMADEELVLAVVDRLEDKGALQLAHRLRRTLEMGAVGSNGRVRLWSDPAPKNRPRAPPDNRVPLVPRRAYPEPTEQGRRTHHWNLLLTQWLTVRHPIPYASPFPRQKPNGHTAAPARLRRLRDVLHTIDKLRASRGFVPDRVTANIVLKAYLSCLARGTIGEGRDAHPLPFRPGLRAEDLRDVFRLIAESIEDGLNKGLVVREDVGEDGEDSKRAMSKRATSTRKGPNVRLAGLEILDKFDPHVSYEAHVQPFARMMGRAMARVGDHRGRVAIEKWAEVMRERIHKLQGRAGVIGGGADKAGGEKDKGDGGA